MSLTAIATTDTTDELDGFRIRNRMVGWEVLWKFCSEQMQLNTECPETDFIE